MLARTCAFVGARHERFGQCGRVRAVLRFGKARHEMQVGRKLVALRKHGETLRPQTKMRCWIGKAGEGRFGARTDLDGGKRLCAGFTHDALLTNRTGHVERSRVSRDRRMKPARLTRAGIALYR